MSGPAPSHLYDGVKISDAAQTQKMAQEARAYEAFDSALQGDPNQFAVVPDPDHRDLGRLSFLGDERAMAIAQKNGVQDIVIERPASLQPLADKLARHEITEDQFIKEMKAKYIPTTQISDADQEALHRKTAQLITNAQKHGIKVHFGDIAVDQQHPESEYGPHVRAFDNELARRMKETGLAEGSPAYIEKYREISGELFNKLSDAEQKAVIAETLAPRMKDDQKVGQYIKSRVGNHKTLVFYGREHTDAGLTKELNKPGLFSKKGPGISEIHISPDPQAGPTVYKSMVPGAMLDQFNAKPGATPP